MSNEEEYLSGLIEQAKAGNKDCVQTLIDIYSRYEWKRESIEYHLYDLKQAQYWTLQSIRLSEYGREDPMYYLLFFQASFSGDDHMLVLAGLQMGGAYEKEAIELFQCSDNQIQLSYDVGCIGFTVYNCRTPGTNEHINVYLKCIRAARNAALQWIHANPIGNKDITLMIAKMIWKSRCDANAWYRSPRWKFW